MKEKLLLLCALIFATQLSIQAQYTFDNVLYGAAYYHEYMPEERLDEDIRLMKEAGLSVVRVGESAWGIFEPQEGQFQFEWMDRIIQKMHEAGIQVILGTPTYSMPAWLAKKHPEVLINYLDGRQAHYGIRQNMDFTHPVFLQYSERIIRKMMERYANHPAIIGFQVDNETETRNMNNPGYSDGFRDYVRKRFNNDLDSLNRAWGLSYWGMNINKWDEFYSREGVTNPSYKNEWERYNRQSVADFLNWQCDIVNEYKRNDQFVTHCFMPAFHNIDQIESFRQMDYPAINVYHSVQDKQDGQQIAYAGDFMRRVKKGNYIVMETNAQGIGWDAKGQYPPYDNQLRQNMYGHLASGANMVEYWHWATLHYGQETYWRGILGHDLQPNRVYNEFKTTADELKRIGPKLTNLQKANKVAILYSHDSYHALQFMPYSSKENYPIELVHRALYNQNIETDILSCDKNHDFAGYEMLVIPPLYVATDSLLQKIDQFIEAGGHVVMLYKSAYCNEHSAVRAMLAPGPLRNACGFYYQEFSTIGKLKLKYNPYLLGSNDQISDWYEMLIPETATALAYADHPFFGNWPVITVNDYGKGRMTYVGTYPSQELMDAVVRKAAEDAGLIDDSQLRFPLIVRSGTSNQGKKLHYLFNYSAEQKQLANPFAKSQELLSHRAVEAGDLLTLQPWDVVILEEQ